jgi:hypothetical protein
MKNREQLSKWAVGVLGVVCLVLVVHLVRSFGRIRVKTAAAAGHTAAGARAPLRSDTARRGDTVSQYDPELKLALLKKLTSRPPAQISRDPFAYTPPARPAPPGAPPEAAAPPAPPPPPPLKAVGFMEMPGGAREAYVSYEDQVYSVQEGDTIANKFKVLKVTPAQVEVQDESSKETIKLPVTQ